MLGDYARTAAPDLLMHHELPQHLTSIAELRGVRFVTSSETGEGARIADLLIKFLTGGEIRSARFMHEDLFQYTPTDTFWLATNHKPVVRDTSTGFWRRWRLVPCVVEIPEERQDKYLKTKLEAEFPGILAWAVRGCLAWQKEGLGNAGAIDAATQTYRTEMDTLGAFLEERCIVIEGARVGADELYSSFVEWAKAAGERELVQALPGHQDQRARLRDHPDGRRGSIRLGRGSACAGPRTRRTSSTTPNPGHPSPNPNPNSTTSSAPATFPA